MALEIGGGITLGGGISLTVESGGGGGAASNSIVVANITSGPYDYYGALLTTGNIYLNPGTGDFGTVNSDSIYALYYETDNSNNFDTIIMLNGGTYTGFSVANGVIDSDDVTYPRVFTIGGTDYTFNLNTNGQYKLSGDPISLTTKVGNTVSLVYDPNNQITVSPNTMIVGSYEQSGTTYYGASKEGNFFGTLASSYIKSIKFDGTVTSIQLSNGTYTGFSVTNGGIDSDTSGSTRVFTIGGTARTFTAGGTPSSLNYIVMGNPLSLDTNVGQTITTVYDPAAQPAPPEPFVDGTAYAVTTDYSSSAMVINGNPMLGYTVFIKASEWTTTAGYDALYALTTGDRFKVYTYLAAGGQGDSVVTLTSGFSSFMDGYQATATLSVNVATNNTIDTITLEAAAGGTTYTNTSTTFLGNGDAPPWVVSSLYNSGTLFKITTASSPSSEFLAAINALTTGSQLTIVDTSEGTVNITLTSGFSGTYTTGNEEYSASCTSTGSFSTGITSITIL